MFKWTDMPEEAYITMRLKELGMSEEKAIDMVKEIMECLEPFNE